MNIPAAKITEQPIEPHILSGIAGSAEEGAALLKVSVDAQPLKIVEAINAFVTKPPRKFFGRVDNWEDRALPLGSLWGQQMVRAFGWEWAGVTFHDHEDAQANGVFTKNRSLAIYPWYFIFGCLENNAPVTILLSFNMLQAGKIPEPQPGEYINVMEGVHHIIPPG